MANLTDDIKTLIVDRLACFVTPSQIIEELRKDHNLTVNSNQVVYYNPRAAQSRHIHPKWVELFESRRKAFVIRVSDLPGYHQAYRLSVLQALLEKNLANGKTASPRLTMEILKQMAEEAGDKYTNKIKNEISGSLNVSNFGKLTDEQLDELIKSAEARASIEAT